MKAPISDSILNLTAFTSLIFFCSKPNISKINWVEKLPKGIINLGLITFKNRIIKIDVFPMGIDYKKYSTSYELKSVQEEANEIFEKTRELQVILSVDRLDYTKGILHRLNAFELFLSNHPEWHKKIIYLMLCVPSRTNVSDYLSLKNEVDGLIGKINGRYGTHEWIPIHYLKPTDNRYLEVTTE